VPRAVASYGLFFVVSVAFLSCRHAETTRAQVTAKAPRAVKESPDSPSRAKAPKRETKEQEVDRMVLEWLRANAQPKTDEIDDALPNESFCLTVRRDPGSLVWDKVLVDLDRDGKIDEKWLLNAGGPGKKRVSTSDDGHFDREERWRDSRWVRRRGN
jgi:hypothetical protein